MIRDRNLPLYGIPAKVDALKARYHARDIRMTEVQLARRGDFESISPDLFNDEFSRPIVANLIDTAARDMASMLAPLPAFNCSATSMVSDSAKRFADRRTKIVRHYLDHSDTEYQMLSAADHYNSYGMIVTYVRPDMDDSVPYLCFEDPVGSYPVFDRDGECTAFARVYMRDWFGLLADYPQLERIYHSDMYPAAVSSNNEVEVAHWCDGERILVYLPKMGNEVVEEIANPMGRCLYVVTRRPGPDDQVRGAYDDVIWVQLARHRMQMLLMEGLDKAVRAPIVVPPDVGEIPLGPDAVIRTQMGVQAVGRARLEMPAQAFGALEQLRAEVLQGSMSPEGRTGQVDASVITGQGLQQLAQGFSGQVRTAQSSFRRHFKKVIELAFEMDEVLFGAVEKDIRGEDAGVPYSIRYRPDRDVRGDHTVDVQYGFASGMDPNRALVFLLQADGAGLLSKDYVRRNLPVGLNAADEEQKIAIETSRAGLLAAFAGLAQAIPQVAATGGDPSQPLMAYAKFIGELQKGRPVEDAAQTALTPPEQPPAPAGPPAPVGPEAAATGGPEGPEQGAGAVPGATGVGAGNRPDLQMLFAGLTGTGSPNLQAGVSRYLPTGA